MWWLPLFHITSSHLYFGHIHLKECNKIWRGIKSHFNGCMRAIPLAMSGPWRGQLHSRQMGTNEGRTKKFRTAERQGGRSDPCSDANFAAKEIPRALLSGNWETFPNPQFSSFNMMHFASPFPTCWRLFNTDIVVRLWCCCCCCCYCCFSYHGARNRLKVKLNFNVALRRGMEFGRVDSVDWDLEQSDKGQGQAGFLYLKNSGDGVQVAGEGEGFTCAFAFAGAACDCDRFVSRLKATMILLGGYTMQQHHDVVVLRAGSSQLELCRARARALCFSLRWRSCSIFIYLYQCQSGESISQQFRLCRFNYGLCRRVEGMRNFLSLHGRCACNSKNTFNSFSYSKVLSKARFEAVGKIME